MPSLSKVIGSFRKKRDDKSVQNAPPAAPTGTASGSRTTTGSNTTSQSQSSPRTGSNSALSSRRTSEELNKHPEVIVSQAHASTLIREATGFQAQPGEALVEDRLLAEAGIALCALAGYNKTKTTKLLHRLPEYGCAGNRLPDLNFENLYRGIQQRRADSYLAFVDFDGVDPMRHRIEADRIFFELFGDSPTDFMDEILRQELSHWCDTWTDEINILGQHEEHARAEEIRKRLDEYVDNLPLAIGQVRTAHERRLRKSANLQRFHSEANQRRAKIASNKYAVRGSAYKNPDAVVKKAELELEEQRAQASLASQRAEEVSGSQK